MTDSERPKPLPARSVTPPSPVEGSAEPLPSEPAPSQAPSTPTPDPPEEVRVPWRGGTWIARVLGRSGRSEARAAPLMLVGFWDPAAAAGAHTLESTVAGRRLADVPEETLLDALARARTPPMAGQRRPFFDDSDPTRRSGPASEY